MATLSAQERGLQAQKHLPKTANIAVGREKTVSVSAMLVSMRQKNIAQVSILERYFFVSTYQAAGPDTCLAVFVVASLPPCL